MTMKSKRAGAPIRTGSPRMLLELIEPRYHLSADTSLAALRSAFTGGNADRVASDLLTSYFSSSTAASKAQVAATKASVAAVGGGGGAADVVPYVTDAAGRVGVVITATDPGKLLASLGKLGVLVAASLQKYHRIEAFLPLAALPAVSALGGSGLLGITPVYRPMHRTGTVESQADNVLEADRVRASVPGYTGAGVKIGVLSDSYNKYASSPASASISSGNLPNNVQVLQDDNTAATDEGRAMLELIYDVAPGAQLGFATADISESGFASNIRALASNGYKVIVDDVAYLDEPFFQDGIVAQAVSDVVAGGAAYFSAAGNEGNLSYDSGDTSGVTKGYGASSLSFASQTISTISSSASSYFDFNPGAAVDTQMSITIPSGSSISLNLQYDQPFYTASGVTTNLDVYLLSTNTTTGVQTIRRSAQTNNLSTQQPFEFLQNYTNSLTGTSATTTFNLVIRNTNGGPVPGRIKFIDEVGDPSVKYNEYFTYSSTIVGHAAAAGAAAVGAAPYFQQTTPESFSSTGPSTILFNADGTRKATAEVRPGPAFLSIDGADTSFFYPGEDDDGNGLYNFFGTSAAAPNAAAVAALVLQANPSFTPAQLYARLKSTADTTNLTTTDPNVVGAGLINAYRAVFGAPVATGLIYSDGFESGALGRQWQVNKQGSGYAMVTTTLAPKSGADHLVLGQNIGTGTTSFSLPGLAESTLHLNLAGKPGVTLTFDEKEFANEADNAMPATFAGHGNYDGVSFSVDGVTWYRLVSLTGASSTTTYQTQSYNISAAAAALGVTLTADTQVKFQEYSASASLIGYSGIALDNVVVSALSSLTSIVIDDGTAQRSRVRSVTLNVLGTLAANVPAAAFSLKRNSDNLAVPIVVSSVTNPTPGTSKVVLTFAGASLEYGSLADGIYTLSVDGGQLRDNANRAVDVDGDGAEGGVKTQSLFRLFADGSGDGMVTIVDFNVFAATFGSNAAQSIFVDAYDYNGDGQITIVDFNQLVGRFGTSVS